MHSMNAIQYPFSDQKWFSKILIATLLSFIPLLGQFLLNGYGIRAITRLYEGNEGMPEWDDFGSDFIRGLLVFFGQLLYSFPIIIVFICVAIAASADESLAFLYCFVFIGFLIYGLLAFPMIAAAMARYAATDDFMVFLDFPGRLRDVIAHIGDAILLYIDIIIFGILASIVVTIGYVLCLCPGFLMQAAVTIGANYIFAQWGYTIGVKAKKRFYDDSPGIIA